MASEGIVPVKSSRRYFWIILPLILGLLGGFIVYFILRKKDIKIANICLLVGLGISVVWTVGMIASAQNEPEPWQVPNEKIFINYTEEEKLAQRLTLQKYWDEVDAKQKSRDATNAKIAAKLANRFDPTIVASAKKNIPELQEFTKGILDECRAVKSYEDYQIFLIVLSVVGEEMIDVTYKIDAALTVLELDGYDEHPEVGPLITETRLLSLQTSGCLADMKIRYN